MRKTTFILAVTAMMATSVAAFGQVIPANTTFFDYDFTATDQMTADVDATGVFTGSSINRGPFEDRTLSGNTSLVPAVFGQVGFESSNNGMNKYGTYLDVDTTNGYAQESSDASIYQNTNIFIGQPKISIGDTIRLISELSFDKPSVEDAMNPGTFVEGNSQDHNFFFGFRAGSGGGEFQPNDGVAQAFRFNLGADNTVATDSAVQAYTLSVGGGNGFANGEIAAAAATDLGLGVPANGTDLNPSDVFRIVTDVTYTSSDATSSTFTAETKIEALDGTQLGTTATTVMVDAGIFTAGERIQFAIRDAASAPVGNPQNLRIHRLAAIFNPDDSTGALKGDVDLSTVVDFGDIAPFIALLQSGGFQAEADCDCSGAVDFGDISAFITILQGG